MIAAASYYKLAIAFAILFYLQRKHFSSANKEALTQKMYEEVELVFGRQDTKIHLCVTDKGHLNCKFHNPTD